MEREKTALMRLVGMAAAGSAVEWLGDVRVDHLIALAREQMVLPLLMCALKAFPERTDALALYQAEKAALEEQIVFDYMRKCRLQKLLDAFQSAGIAAIMLKGYAVADCYAQPAYRISGDVDLYVAPPHAKAAAALLEAHQCKVPPMRKGDYHAVCEHPQLGRVELHTALFRDITEKALLGRASRTDLFTEPLLWMDCPDGLTGWTLGATDHMIFLALHMIKHFAASGINLRMMSDLACYYRRHADAIDIGRFARLMAKSGNIGMIDAVFAIAQNHLGISSGYERQGETSDETCQMLLADCFARKWAGETLLEWESSGVNAFRRLRVIKTMGGVKGRLYAAGWRAEAYLSMARKGNEVVAAQEPRVRRNPFLLPARWAGLWAAHMRGPSRKSAKNQANARLMLFRKLRMLE